MPVPVIGAYDGGLCSSQGSEKEKEERLHEVLVLPAKIHCRDSTPPQKDGLQKICGT